MIGRVPTDQARGHPLSDNLAVTTTVLDGGLSNALEARGADLGSALWTARVLRDQPELVAGVHEDYFLAGADVATTATYQATDPVLLRLGVRVARAVRDRLAPELGRPLLVAASVGPYGAVLADGSEYTGRYGLTAAQLRDFHAPRLEVLAAEAPDLLAVETVPDLDEAVVVADLLDDLGVPAWLSYSVAGGRTRGGQPLGEAYAVLAGRHHLVAAGVNCSSPEDVLPAVRTAVECTGLPSVAYPNRGEAWDAEAKRWSGGGAFDPALVPEWMAAGAAYVGGCCRVGPDDIRALREVVDGLSTGLPDPLPEDPQP
jgi:homocysteine S-methyltransferase